MKQEHRVFQVPDLSQSRQVLVCKLGQDLEAIVRSETERSVNSVQGRSKQALDNATKAIEQKIQNLLLTSLSAEQEDRMTVLRYLFDRAYFEGKIKVV